MDNIDKVVDYINVQRDRYVDELKQYLAIPSISALPQHQADVRRAAEWSADHMRGIGLENVRLFETPGNPIVYGEWLNAPGAPTILFYGHYDVQPVDPVELWESPPFEATVRENEILRARRGRRQGAGLHALQGDRSAHEAVRPPAAQHQGVSRGRRGSRQPAPRRVRARRTSRSSPPTSSSFPTPRCSRAKSRRSATACAGSSITRSICAERKAICTPASSAAPWPIRRSCSSQMLAQMKDKSGRVKIAGFYDDVRELTEAERAEWKKLPFDEKKYRKEWGAPKLAGESGYTVLERVWGRPTFEVNGLLSGFTGEGPKTVLPAVAMAKVSMRLVPNQDPDKIAKLFEEYVKKIAPPTVELKLTRLHGGKPWMAEFDSPYIRAAGRAIEKGFGKTPVFTREGGSIPVVATFQEELGIPSVLFGVGLPDENAHAPNEKLDLGNFHGGVIASAHLYEEIAKLRA